MADFLNPKNTNPLLSIFGYVRDGLSSVAKMFDGTTDSNIPTDAKKIDKTTKEVSNWNGASWDVIGSVETSIDADIRSVSNLEVDNFKASAYATSIATPGVDTKFATEKAVRDVINIIPNTITSLGLSSFDGSFGQNSSYSRSGDLVVVDCSINISGLGTSGANSFIITGLPYAVQNNKCVSCVLTSSWAVSPTVTVLAVGSTTTVSLKTITNSSIQYSDIGVGGAVEFTLTYKA